MDIVLAIKIKNALVSFSIDIILSKTFACQQNELG